LQETSDWAQLKALFNAAIELTGAERAAYLDGASRDHPRLAGKLRALMASHAQASAFLEQPAIAEVVDGGLDASEPVAKGCGPLDTGAVLDGTYEVEARLGEGGMGVVYRVRHRALARTFAAKVIHARAAGDPAFQRRFTREAEALGKLRHPHIVDVTDFGIDAGEAPQPYLVMELLEGSTLQDRIGTGPLDLAAALPIFEGIAAALDHAHERGVLHLDLKPGNILLIDGPGNRPWPKILDFGLAQFVQPEELDAARPSGDRPIGTPAYMAPEMLNGGRPSAAADIHALGVVMFEALAGRPPFEGSTARILDQLRHDAPPAASGLNAALPSELDHALAVVLSKDPTARPATAVDAVAAVRRAWLAAKRRQWRQTEVPRRLAAAGAIAAVLTLAASLVQPAPVRALERRAVDVRFALSAPRPPGPAILLLLLDDASLAADVTPLAQRAEQFGLDLARVFDAGARGVALDFLVPESWSHSPAFARLALRHGERLTLSAFSSASGAVIGPEAISGVTTAAMGPDRASALFGFVNLDQDDDGVSRRARLWYRDRDGAARPSFAARAAATAGFDATDTGRTTRADEFWIDHTIDADRFERVSWKDLDLALRTQPESFQDRLVIAGADYAGSGDEARIPNRGVVPGVMLHALTADTILARFPIRDANGLALTIVVGTANALLCAAMLLARRARFGFVLVILVGAAYSALAVLVFGRTRILLPVAMPLVVCGIGAAVAALIRRCRPVFPSD
jgi:serine/threonine-protein kinase